MMTIGKCPAKLADKPAERRLALVPYRKTENAEDECRTAIERRPGRLVVRVRTPALQAGADQGCPDRRRIEEERDDVGMKLSQIENIHEHADGAGHDGHEQYPVPANVQNDCHEIPRQIPVAGEHNHHRKQRHCRGNQQEPLRAGGHLIEANQWFRERVLYRIQDCGEKRIFCNLRKCRHWKPCLAISKILFFKTTSVRWNRALPVRHR